MDTPFQPLLRTFVIDGSEVGRIISLCERFPSDVAHIVQESRYRFVPTTRNVKVQWIPNIVPTKWLFDFWSKKLVVDPARIGALSYLTYRVGDHYAWHADVGEALSDIAWRKLAVSTQLSAPDEYEGGELELRADPHNFVVNKELGATTTFNPNIAHRVTPVTRGIRRALVFWVGEAGKAAPNR